LSAPILRALTDDILLYFRDEGVKVSTSLDGPAFLHNKNRPRPGHNSYEKAIEGIERSRAILGMENVAALMTTTAASLDHAAAIVDEYVRREFHSIFLRPISPMGSRSRPATAPGTRWTASLSSTRRASRISSR